MNLPLDTFHISALPSCLPTIILFRNVGRLAMQLTKGTGDMPCRVVYSSKVIPFHTSYWVSQTPTIHDPKIQKLFTFSLQSRGICSSACFLPRLNTHTPLCSPASFPPHAANTLSFHAALAVMTSGVCGRVTKTRFNPLFRSYVCKLRPTEVDIWNVVLPNGTVVKGTAVGDTRPMVRYGANNRDAPRLRLVFVAPFASFCLFATGPPSTTSMLLSRRSHSLIGSSRKVWKGVKRVFA